MRNPNFILYLLLSIGILGCTANEKSTSEKHVDGTILKGKFIRVKDNNRAGLEGVFNLVSDIEFRNEHCHFTYVGTKMSGKFNVDEGFIYVYTGSELGTLSLEIVSNDILEGEGFIHGTFKREGTFVPAKNEKKYNGSSKPKNEDLTSKKNQGTNPFNSYNGNKEKIDESSESSKSKSENPFGSGGPSTTNNDNGSFGNDQGLGSSESASGEGRIRLTDPSIEHIVTNVTIIVSLKLTINADGNVVSAISTSKTTTTDQSIINKVISAVKNQVKYNKDPDSGLVTTFLTLKINAQ